MDFKITAPFEPDGDQPQAIEKLAEGIEKGLRTQVLVWGYRNWENLYYCAGY